MVEATNYVAYWTKAWEDATAYYYTVEDSSGLVCGSCGMGDLNIERSSTAIGYWIRSSATGRGLATAAVRAIAAAAWDDFEEISIVVAEPNVASRRVAEKAGAVFRPGFGGTVYSKGAQVPGLQYVMPERPQ
jgi:RimJ/RimL family protein N-acetyltransferase